MIYLYVFVQTSKGDRDRLVSHQGDNFIATHYALLEGRPVARPLAASDDLGERLNRLGMREIHQDNAHMHRIKGLVIVVKQLSYSGSMWFTPW